MDEQRLIQVVEDDEATLAFLLDNPAAHVEHGRGGQSATLTRVPSAMPRPATATRPSANIPVRTGKSRALPASCTA
jgi:hypothetical protein